LAIPGGKLGGQSWQVLAVGALPDGAYRRPARVPSVGPCLAPRQPSLAFAIRSNRETSGAKTPRPMPSLGITWECLATLHHDCLLATRNDCSTHISSSLCACTSVACPFLFEKPSFPLHRMLGPKKKLHVQGREKFCFQARSIAWGIGRFMKKTLSTQQNRRDCLKRLTFDISCINGLRQAFPPKAKRSRSLVPSTWRTRDFPKLGRRRFTQPPF